ncbi:MAG: chemotaxis protein [Defluviitaleaceae bacterium]|nr:chemotaxis protein [Defluviitaleaceae bacterium]
MTALASKNEILLETGTNELEVMEFTIGDRNFGINVSKVHEILRYSDHQITPMPNSNEYVEGVFKPRGAILTVVNLPSYLGLPASGSDKDILIVTNFNGVYTAFHVHSVVEIHRISWRDIEKPDPAIYHGEEGLVTGIARYKEHLITIIDFEKILADINPAASIKVSDIDKLGARQRSDKPILIAEDSPLLERLIIQSLEKSGYANIIGASNGQEAWDTLLAMKEKGGRVSDHVKIVITDIEMPKMDGHRLLKLIRDDAELKSLPVIIFSSLINENMRIKGEELGATAQITKPEIGSLVGLIDKHILE